MSTYSELVNLATTNGSWDGGDQGLLNTFFSDWATKDLTKHLPFTYNMVASASYSYLPAYKQSVLSQTSLSSVSSLGKPSKKKYETLDIVQSSPKEVWTKKGWMLRLGSDPPLKACRSF